MLMDRLRRDENRHGLVEDVDINLRGVPSCRESSHDRRSVFLNPALWVPVPTMSKCSGRHKRLELFPLFL